ncbi:hypothetical protein Pcinc_038620 [Petrolisthes cinctipes]|uniref:Uncharacterized protein n=1 Tax=Petrolisthes cinctipes TaxID=88211 RepID=A0AAE1BQ65_PETCI|nr:hypothetical protein Pcinc_038620 [Petrolisthes cinctipes]
MEGGLGWMGAWEEREGMGTQKEVQRGREEDGYGWRGGMVVYSGEREGGKSRWRGEEGRIGVGGGERKRDGGGALVEERGMDGGGVDRERNGVGGGREGVEREGGSEGWRRGVWWMVEGV